MTEKDEWQRMTYHERALACEARGLNLAAEYWWRLGREWYDWTMSEMNAEW